jgi:hypothetical protein
MIFNVNIPSTGAKILQTAIGYSYAVTSMFFCNTSDDQNEFLNLYIVQKDKNVSNDALVVKNIEIKATDTFTFDTEKLVLEEGDYIYATSTNGNLSAVLSVMNIS